MIDCFIEPLFNEANHSLAVEVQDPDATPAGVFMRVIAVQYQFPVGRTCLDTLLNLGCHPDEFHQVSIGYSPALRDSLDSCEPLVNPRGGIDVLIDNGRI